MTKTRKLGDADHKNRFRIYYPVTEQGRDIYVHAKIMVVDDLMLRVGPFGRVVTKRKFPMSTKAGSPTAGLPGRCGRHTSRCATTSPAASAGIWKQLPGVPGTPG